MEHNFTNYFITGLPRSRTGWCANFLTCDGHYCRHDTIGEVDDIAKLPAKIGRDGVSDPGLLLFWETVAKTFPGSRYVVIERDFRDCLISARDAFPHWQDYGFEWAHGFMMNLWHAKEELISSGLPVLRLDFDDLDAAALWRFCRPNDPYDAKRYEMLKHYRVENMLDNDAVTAQNVGSLMDTQAAVGVH